MRIFALLTVPVLTLGAGLAVAAPASAHTPNISASCDGVHVGATAYDASMANHWSVTIGGVTQTGTFGSSFDQTFPVPQDGATTAWSAFVEAADGSYHGEQSGSVGPCGTPPPADACADLPGAQPEGTPCTPPPDVERTDAEHLAGCDVAFGGTSYGAGELTYDELYTDTYVFDDATSTWQLVTDTEPTISDVAFTPWTTEQEVAHGCTDRAPQPPAERERHRSTRLDCDDEVRVTTVVTTVTPYVYDDDTNDWVLGTPVEHTVTHEQPVKPGVCHDTGVSANEAFATTSAPAAGSSAVPTSIAAGVSGTTSARPQAASLAPAASPAAPSPAPRVPALVLMLSGAFVLAGAALRLRRS